MVLLPLSLFPRAAGAEKPTIRTLTPPIPASRYDTVYRESDEGLEKHRLFLWQGGFRYTVYTYHSYTPKKLKPGKQNPAIILLHGARRSGIVMAEKWKKSADRHGIKVFAPTGQAGQYFHGKDADKGLAADRLDNDMAAKLIEKIKTDDSVDPARIYIFGHSDGAIAALRIGAAQSENLAAVAIHAGYIYDEDHLAAIRAAKRKIPHCLFIGTRDRVFPIDQVHYAAELIADEGHNTLVTEIEGHSHWYYTLAEWINEEAWNCMTGLTKNAQQAP